MFASMAFRCGILLFLVSSLPALTQTPPANPSAPAPQTAPEVDPLKRPVDAKRSKQQNRSLKLELGKRWEIWLNDDVASIITDEERQAFLQLGTEEEREKFVEIFWNRRNSNRYAAEGDVNEAREEHYRRVAYANEHFAAGIPGRKTDRGQVYIRFGPPDQIESHAGGMYQRPPEEGGGTTSTYPFEVWRYRHLEGPGLGENIEIEFVDDCMCGQYRRTIDRGAKDALAKVPGAGPTDCEASGQCSKADRFNNGLETIGSGRFNQGNQFDRLERDAAISRAPEPKYRDLAFRADAHIVTNLLPFDVRADFVKITSDMVMVPITIQVRNGDLTWKGSDGVQKMTLNIFGRVSNMTGSPVQTFEDNVSGMVPDSLLAKVVDNSHVYWKSLPLRPGRYKLDIVVKDVNSDRVGTWFKGFTVPDYSGDKLSSSTLILADQMERVSLKNPASSDYVIGSTRIRPRVPPADGTPAIFKRSQPLNVWMQVYSLAIDPETHRSRAHVDYELVNAVTKQPVAHVEESSDKPPNSGEQITLERYFPLTSVPPGVYEVRVTVHDQVANQLISRTENVKIE